MAVLACKANWSSLYLVAKQTCQVHSWFLPPILAQFYTTKQSRLLKCGTKIIAQNIVLERENS